MGADNRGTGVPRPYANTEEAIRAMGSVACSTGVARHVVSPEGRNLIVPPQPDRRNEDGVDHGPQDIHSYGISRGVRCIEEEE